MIRGAFVLVRLQCLEGAVEGVGNHIVVPAWANDDGELEAVAPPCWPFKNESNYYEPTGEIIEMKDVFEVRKT